ncbi:FtsX-like permease family protein [Leptotrichia sp. OH3620_COT-345]|uniref:FtsX-like permease family protein n=1 Tax=Leptotrichia sp. OH3620_COT-345 TaxID=2491048 RepID=UPI00131579FE|nr:ABC transporter permease [Leptotrichia sp. OH3620_COT-345]
MNNIILFLFITLSVTIGATVFLTVSQLFSTISGMYDVAKPPHFLQMHKGEINQDNIDKFNKSYPDAVYWQTVPLINISGNEITVQKNKVKNSKEGFEKEFILEESRMGISLVKQNESHDLLLDKNRQRVVINKGEIGVPVILLDKFSIDIGDVIIINTGGMRREFTVSKFIYDAQMNSTMVSSTRFLISDEDFSQLFSGEAEKEYIIETYFKKTSMASAYQTAYEQSVLNLPKNGQAVTYVAIFLISAMTDIMTAIVFLITGFLLTTISLICLRYIILSDLENDFKEIGTMKALGISSKGISELYMLKIKILAASGGIVGFFAALLLVPQMTGHMSRTFGKMDKNIIRYMGGFLICVGIYMFIILFSKRIMKRIGKVTVVDLLVRGKGFLKERKLKDNAKKEEHRKKLFPSIYKNIFSFPLSANAAVSIRKIKKGYGIILWLSMITMFFVMLPFRTASTLGNREFVTYMGVPVSDYLLEIQQGEDIETRRENLEKFLKNKKELQNNDGNNGDIQYSILRRVRLQGISREGKTMGIYTDIGKHAGEGLRFLKGKRAKKENEIALSLLTAEDMGKAVGEKITIISEEGEKDFLVSGIYQDITSGGKTAKMLYDFKNIPTQKYIFYINNKNASKKSLDRVKKETDQWRKELGTGYTLESMEEFTGQTIGGVAERIQYASFYTLATGVLLTVLITALFMKLQIVRRGKEFATKKTLGISRRDINLQEYYPTVIMASAGMIMGFVFLNVFGDKVLSFLFVMGNLGISKITFTPPSFMEYIIIPEFFLFSLTLTVFILCKGITKINIIDYVNE